VGAIRIELAPLVEAEVPHVCATNSRTRNIDAAKERCTFKQEKLILLARKIRLHDKIVKCQNLGYPEFFAESHS